MNKVQIRALRLAERFIFAETAVRERSYMPNPTVAEAADISEGKVALAAVRAALRDQLRPPNALQGCEQGCERRVLLTSLGGGRL